MKIVDLSHVIATDNRKGDMASFGWRGGFRGITRYACNVTGCMNQNQHALGTIPL